MGIINLLPGEISNKIAAGEVVERPASVVKELVENSIDAASSVITVDISKGGTGYIRVTDNGKGMSADDAKICFLRHATSKIKTDSDLDAIYTLGFRGEALSSIGAVAKVSLYTRTKDSAGTCVKCEGGEILSSEEAGLQRGTAIIVENLFYNTPARAKFLKKDATEAGYITDIMSRFILAHPEISFRLNVNGKEKLFSPGDGSIENAVSTIYGRDYAKNLIKVDYTSEGVRVKGVIGNSNLSRPNRTQESFFVNCRYVKSPKLMNALEEAFKNQIMIGKFPFAALNIEINPLFIDINVHPTKLEVKFSDDRLVYQTVYYGVKNALYAIPEPEEEPEKATDFLGIPTDMLKRPNTPKFNPRENPFIKSSNANTLKESFGNLFKAPSKSEVSDVTYTSEPKPENTSVPLSRGILNALTDEKSDEMRFIPENSVILQYKNKVHKTPEIEEVSDLAEPAEEILEYFKIAGQIFDTYIIAEQDDKMLIIDQHAAHERLKYEELLDELESTGLYSQILIEPLNIRLDGTDSAAYSEAEEELHKLGFECCEENGIVTVTGIPSQIDMSEAEELVIELITQFAEGKRELISATRQRMIYTIACKAAIKANHRLSEAEAEALVRQVLMLEKQKKRTCPHGRPITIVKTKKEIEKDFKRIV